MSQRNINPDPYKKNPPPTQQKITPQFFYNGFPTQIPPNNMVYQNTLPQGPRYPYLNKNIPQAKPQMMPNQQPINNISFQRNQMPNNYQPTYPIIAQQQQQQQIPKSIPNWSPYPPNRPAPMNVQNSRPKDPKTRALVAEATDKQKALFPDYKSPFKNNDDMYNRLYVYHVFNSKTTEEEQQWNDKVDNVSKQFIGRTNKLKVFYNKLLQRESESQPTEELLFADVLLWKDEEGEWNSQKEKMKKEMDQKIKNENIISFSLDKNENILEDDFLISTTGFQIHEEDREPIPNSLFGDSDDENTKDEDFSSANENFIDGFFSE